LIGRLLPKGWQGYSSDSVSTIDLCCSRTITLQLDSIVQLTSNASRIWEEFGLVLRRTSSTVIPYNSTGVYSNL